MTCLHPILECLVQDPALLALNVDLGKQQVIPQVFCPCHSHGKLRVLGLGFNLIQAQMLVTFGEFAYLSVFQRNSYIIKS